MSFRFPLWLLLLSLFASASCQASEFAERQLQLVATNYQMHYQLHLADEDLCAHATLTVKNISNTPADHIPLSLYRLLQISKITDTKQQPLAFTQRVMSDEAFRQRQINYAEVTLPQPLAPQQSYSINISFDGMILGYAETGWLYTKDSINSDFSIIRPDVYAYPLVLYPNDDVNRQAKWWLHRFNYDVTIEVPTGYVVANAGKLLAKNTSGDTVSYRYQNTLPAWLHCCQISHLPTARLNPVLARRPSVIHTVLKPQQCSTFTV